MRLAVLDTHSELPTPVVSVRVNTRVNIVGQPLCRFLPGMAGKDSRRAPDLQPGHSILVIRIATAFDQALLSTATGIP